MKQTLTELKREMNNSTVREFNALSSVIDTTARFKINKAIRELRGSVK